MNSSRPTIPAAVLDWRISHSPTQPGPDRARRVRDLVEEVHASAADPAARQRLPWAEAIADAPDVALPGDLAVWRAALGIPHDDLRPILSLPTMRHDISAASNAA